MLSSRLGAIELTILHTILRRGFFPKELPPAFYTELFAEYAQTKPGRQILATYKPVNRCTECVHYRLALPGRHTRELRIPHPASFAEVAGLVSKNFRRLLKKASSSPFAKSRPVFVTDRY